MKIEIELDDYIQMRIAEIKLEKLENGGVDNWEWYSESLYTEDGEEFNPEKITSDILKKFGVSK